MTLVQSFLLAVGIIAAIAGGMTLFVWGGPLVGLPITGVVFLTAILYASSN